MRRSSPAILLPWGCGPVAQMTIQNCWILGGRRVIAIDRVPERLDMAAAHGKADTINFCNARPMECIRMSVIESSHMLYESWTSGTTPCRSRRDFPKGITHCEKNYDSLCNDLFGVSRIITLFVRESSGTAACSSCCQQTKNSWIRRYPVNSLTKIS
jgi:hypothetical protein